MQINILYLHLRSVDKRDAALVNSVASSLSRVSGDWIDVTNSLDPTKAEKSVQRVIKPPSLAGSMKKMGIALILAPDPITAVPGVTFLAASYVMKKSKPANLETLKREVDGQLGELLSFSLPRMSI